MVDQRPTKNVSAAVGSFMTAQSCLATLAAMLIPLSIMAATSIAAGPASKTVLQQRLQVLLAERDLHATDAAFFVQIADLYLDVGDELYPDVDQRRSAYEGGVSAAQKALDLEEHNAEAHYLYAANLGSAAQLKGIMASAWTVNQVTTHTRRALELNPDHAGALHMMGMLLHELPWIVGGDKAKALNYLKQAVIADPGYVHARLDLAKAYIKRNDADGARRELNAIVNQPEAADESESRRRYRLEAFKLLGSLR